MKIKTNVYGYRYLNKEYENLIIIKIKDMNVEKLEAKTNDILSKIKQKKDLTNITSNNFRGEQTNSRILLVGRGKTSKIKKGVNSSNQTKFSKPNPIYVKPEPIIPKEQY